MKMEEWKEYKLGDIYEVHNGLSKGGKFFGSGYPFLSFSTIFNNWFIPNELSNLVQSTDKEQESYSIKEGDVFITRTSETADELGMSCVALKDYPKATYNGFCKRMRQYNHDIEVNPKYIGYYLRNPNFRLHFQAFSGSMSTRASLTNEALLSLTVKLPPLPTQQKIAAILSSLDDKIELNNKINTNLEQQAQALFKNWFVDFEPFGGKMPEGWKETDIYSIANIIYGSPFASKLFNTEKNGKPIIRIRDLKDQHSDVYTPEERDDAYLIQPKDIVVGMDGEFRPYIWGSEPGWLNQRVSVFENKRPKGNAFLYFSIKPLLDVVEKTQVATTVIHIGKKDFDKFQITLPTEDILDKFDELTDPILDQIVANKLENRRLAELRDTLLPKLMNGEIEV